MVNFNVKCEMKSYNNIEKKLQPTGFYLYPRSSMSKTTLMLANHTGIIDSGYRGYIIGAFRNLASTPVTIEKGQRLLQICSPDLRPFMITLVDEQILSITERGDGGFGSTG
jgi:dUTP pyrophosphatase